MWPEGSVLALFRGNMLPTYRQTQKGHEMYHLRMGGKLTLEDAFTYLTLPHFSVL